MNYLKLTIYLDEEHHEGFIAELMDLDFYGFEQHSDRLIGYIQKPRYNDSNREYIEQLVIAHPSATGMEMGDEEEKNWNETWEESIQPQVIGQFLVRPTWSTQEPEAGQLLLEIDPKMSFGTGYHSTTRLMLARLDKLDVAGKTVLDAGTGTGILSIASLKLGAKNAVGFDVDPWSERNALENALINDVNKKFDVRLGGFEQIKKEEKFDLTLANINRNVIIEYLPDLVNATRPGGTICLSGLMDSDEEKIKGELERYPVTIEHIAQENEWILIQLTVRQND